MRDSVNKINNPFGQRVKDVRKLHKLTQAQLAEAIDVEPNYISMIECGTRHLTKEKAEKISKLFPPVSAAYLMGLSDFKTRDEEDFALLKEDLNRKRDWIIAVDSLISFVVGEKQCSEAFSSGLNSFEEYQSLRREITEYVEFKVCKIAERSIDNGKH